jgi:photosystem II stability/assembly factor-like uncharacterized protein
MKKIGAALALLLLVSSLSAWAGVDRWTPFGRGDDSVVDLLLQPGEPSTLQAVTSDGRVFRSTDGGAAWIFWGLGLEFGTKRIAADPGDPRAMVAVNTVGAVFRSTDAGRFWSRLPRVVDEERDPAVASLATGAGTIYVGGRTLYVSRDGGQSWIDTTPVQDYVPSMTVDPADPLTVWFATFGGLWKTADGGETFSPSLRPPYEIGSPGVTAVAVSPSRPSTVYAGANRRSYVSVDGGATWQPGGDVGIGDLSALAVDLVSPATVYAGGPGGIARSTDAGATWRTLIPFLATSSLVLDPDHPGILYAGTSGDGLYVSRDGGLSWARRDRVGMGYPRTTFIERDPRTSMLYLFHATLGNALLRSADDGRTWTPFGDFAAFQPNLVGLAFDRREPGVLYAASTLHGPFRIEPDGEARRLPLDAVREMYAVATSGPAVLYGNSWAGYRSEDGGETFKAVLPHVVDKGPDPAAWEDDTVRAVLRLIADPADPRTVYAFTNQAGPGTSLDVVLRSDDTGLHWRRLLAGDLEALAVDALDPGTLYVVQRETPREPSTLLRSRDGGRTWRRIARLPFFEVRDLVVDTKHPSVLWAGTAEGVLRSTDGGKTWTPFNAGLARPGLTDIAKLATDPAVPGRLFAMPYAGGLFEITVP